MLKIGDIAPYFSGVDQNGDFISSDRLIQKGPFSLIFYRGYWCNYCMKHLSKLQKAMDNYIVEGYQIIVVTPEAPLNIQRTINETKIKFPVLNDSMNYIMKSYGVDYHPESDKVGPLFRKISLKKVNEQEKVVLPVPASFNIDSRGLISFLHFEKDVKNRADFKDLTSGIELQKNL